MYCRKFKLLNKDERANLNLPKQANIITKRLYNSLTQVLHFHFKLHEQIPHL